MLITADGILLPEGTSLEDYNALSPMEKENLVFLQEHKDGITTLYRRWCNHCFDNGIGRDKEGNMHVYGECKNIEFHKLTDKIHCNKISVK